jgi:hypothetical protein
LEVENLLSSQQPMHFSEDEAELFPLSENMFMPGKSPRYKSSGSCLENRENTAGGIPHADHVARSIRTSWQSLRRQAAVARSV